MISILQSVRKRYSMSAERSVKDSPESATGIALTEFLSVNYSSRFLVEPDSKMTVQAPYIVAYHHFEQLSAQLKPWTDILYAVAVKHSNAQLPFVLDEMENAPLWNISHYSRLEARSVPWICGVDLHENRHTLRGCFRVDTFGAFCDQLLADTLFISEPIPPLTDALVKVAVANNFQELVLANRKDVFITFHKPWCCFSQELLPRLEHVAEILRRDGDDTHIDVVAMNAEMNYVHERYKTHSVSPICLYINSNDKGNLKPYKLGPRTVKNLMKFVACNATRALKNYNRSGQLKGR